MTLVSKQKYKLVQGGVPMGQVVYIEMRGGLARVQRVSLGKKSGDMMLVSVDHLLAIPNQRQVA